jgi:hypothetical protein
LGLALLVAGLIRDVFKDAQIWYVDDLARLFYTLALFLPTIIGFGLGGGSGSSIDIRAVIATLITTGATAGILVVMRRMESKTLQGIRGTIARGPGETLANASRGILNWASKSLRLIGGILEGEGAMLWVFVVLMMVQLAIGGGSR